MKYGNFHNPIRLFFRLAFSINSSARFVPLREALRLILTPLDFVFSKFEKELLIGTDQSKLPIVLIIGSSRSGTTLLYQTLSNCLPFSYFNNLSALFPKSPIFSCKQFNNLLSRKSRSFHNFYGQTKGFSAPNDGFHIWDRWLGDDRYFAPQEISNSKMEDMKNFFYTWLSVFKKPLLNKNNRNSDCILLLSSILDNIYFIRCRRNPIYIAQSLILARQKIQGSKNIGWGVHSKDSDPDSGPFSYIDDVCDQVFSIEMKIRNDLKNIDSDRYIEISYEKFCKEPMHYIKKVANNILGKELDNKFISNSINSFKSTNKPRLSRQEFSRIEGKLLELFGSELHNE